MSILWIEFQPIPKNRHVFAIRLRRFGKAVAGFANWTLVFTWLAAVGLGITVLFYLYKLLGLL